MLGAALATQAAPCPPKPVLQRYSMLPTTRVAAQHCCQDPGSCFPPNILNTCFGEVQGSFSTSLWTPRKPNFEQTDSPVRLPPSPQPSSCSSEFLFCFSETRQQGHTAQPQQSHACGTRVWGCGRGWTMEAGLERLKKHKQNKLKPTNNKRQVGQQQVQGGEGDVVCKANLFASAWCPKCLQRFSPQFLGPNRPHPLRE